MEKIISSFRLDDLRLVVSQKKYKPPVISLPIIDKEWKNLQKTSKGALWNGKIYRLAKYKITRDKITLYLGILDFKVHWATPFLKEFFLDLPFFSRPNGLFTSCYLETSDGQFIFSQKSQSSILAYELNLIGGSLNSDEFIIHQPEDLWLSCMKEITEETKLKKDYIKLDSGVGIYLTDNLRIGIFWKASLFLDSKEILSQIKVNEEHRQLIFLSKEEFRRFLKKKNTIINPYIKETYSLVI